MSVQSVQPVESHYEDYAVILGNVRAEIARRRLSQTAIAAAMGQNQQWLSRRLIGYVPLSVPELMALAQIIGCSLGSLLPHGETPESPDDAERARRYSKPQPSDP